jgi:hypothetical protein
MSFWIVCCNDTPVGVFDSDVIASDRADKWATEAEAEDEKNGGLRMKRYFFVRGPFSLNSPRQGWG